MSCKKVGSTVKITLFCVLALYYLYQHQTLIIYTSYFKKSFFKQLQRVLLGMQQLDNV